MSNPLRREDGALSAEFLAALVPLMIVMVFGWQLLLVVAAGNSAANAARNGSRAAGTGQSCQSAVSAAMPNWIGSSRYTASCGGENVTVRVSVPGLFPNMGWGFTLTRSARLPDTNGVTL